MVGKVATFIGKRIMKMNELNNSACKEGTMKQAILTLLIQFTGVKECFTPMQNLSFSSTKMVSDYCSAELFLQ
ncbi:hypothetical protein DU508_18505 [Pedobacter chinensis]|uniref:Uncharacterized protein n=1 Tax=Pedobacter chinensis TaxID=2282421 RepID=A0A369PRI9_9SPHI|nr:hypothetical protein DU508_18505 [Pedobacter chinensis]